MASLALSMEYAAAAVFGAAIFALVCAADRAAVLGRWRGVPAGTLRQLSPLHIGTVIAGAVAAVLCLLVLGPSLRTLTLFLFLAILAAVSLIDLHTMEIPDWLCIAAAVLGLISYFTVPGESWLSRLIGAFCVSVPLTVITLLIPGAFGGGDIKLMAACGLLLGWRYTLLSAFLALLMGGAWGAVLMATKKKKGSEHIAFGPCLCVGMAVCALAGEWALHAFFTIFDWSRLFT